jgi:hypothetical protein
MAVLTTMSVVPESSSTGSLPSNTKAQEGIADSTTTAMSNTSVPRSAIGDDAKYIDMLVLIGLVCALILFLVLSFGCFTTIRSKYLTSSTKSRQRKDSEESAYYQNMNEKQSKKSRQRKDSEESAVYQNTNKKQSKKSRQRNDSEGNGVDQNTNAKPSKKSWQRNGSEESGVYYNTNAKPSKKSWQRNDSEESGDYHNTHTNPNVWNGDSMKTHMYRQLPALPEEAKPSVDTADGVENDYLIPKLPFQDRYEDEIRNLPPAPPVFPKCFANLPLQGEGPYISVISDDVAQRLPPSSPCEINLDRHSSEIYEENGYLEPRQIRKISVETSLIETKSPKKLKKIEDNKHQKPTRVSPDIRNQRAPKKSQDISEYKSCNAKDESTTNIAESMSETSNDAGAKRFRSTLQIHLSPPPGPRPVSVSTNTATVLVCIHTDY